MQTCKVKGSANDTIKRLEVSVLQREDVPASRSALERVAVLVFPLLCEPESETDWKKGGGDSIKRINLNGASQK